MDAIVYSRNQIAQIAQAWAEGAEPVCPACGILLSPHSVPPRTDVSYVRRRVLLVCQNCGGRAAVESHRRGVQRRSDPPESALTVLGWKEWVHLVGPPNLELRAKVDSGARTSALHAEEVEIVRGQGQHHARFLVRHITRSPDRDGRHEVPQHVEAPVVDERLIRSSSGDEELRPVVLLSLRVAGLDFPAEVTLTRRDSMQFRMLLGRTALKGRFLVDCGRAYLGGVS